MTSRPLIIGNWKMHGLRQSRTVIAEMGAALDGAPVRPIICPPATLIAAFASAVAGGSLQIGAQDCHAAAQGAHTGDLSAEMLADAGAVAVILGHSERRLDHNETDAVISEKLKAARRAGLEPILCVGETAAARENGGAETTVRSQLKGALASLAAGPLVVAYEPVWAIGSGMTPTPQEIAAMHAVIAAELAELGHGPTAIIYGGSVKPDNATEIFAADGVDGALVGGASLAADPFLAITRAAIAAAR